MINIEPLGLYAQLACLWEVTARKPGNVHRFKDFDDVHYLDFVASAAAIGFAFDGLTHVAPPGYIRPGIGRIVLRAISETRNVCRTNTNLGIILLLVPLAMTQWDPKCRFQAKVIELLDQTTIEDAQEAYEAIQLVSPGGLGHVRDQNIGQVPTQSLLEVMTLAADRDLIARQYSNGFREIFDEGVPALQQGLKEIGTLEDAIIHCHLQLMARHPDSLIARKCGKELAEEAGRRAAAVIAAGWPRAPAGRTAIVNFDTWLRADGHRRNPGTTADLVAACLFVALREGIITLPLQVPWSAR